jgi:Skp family chaperone for outer membrane proteins
LHGTIKPLLLLLVAILSSCLISNLYFTPRIAYVDTSKLMVGFSEANKVDREIKSEDDKWQSQLKSLQDSLQASIDTISKYYDISQPAQKKSLQDNLSAWNQRVNNFKQANLRNMEKLRQEKMQGVADKINVYLREYGKAHRYSIVFGTVSGGSILYGDERKYDVTEEIVKGLNERYR